jgi:hypothetical protein
METNISIIPFFEKLEKPDKTFIQDKECLICLESIDLESNKKIVKLPCGCANSVYHTICIIRLLYSGENKNFCPHCKTKYQIPSQQVLIREPEHLQQVPTQQVNSQQVNSQQPVYAQLPNLELQINQINELKLKTFTHIIIMHIISNSIMNIINLSVMDLHPQHNINTEIKVLILFYFVKLLFNYCILIFSKDDLEKIETFLFCSYFFQAVLFGFLIYTFTKIILDHNFIILVLNNIFLNFGDLIYRKIIEKKMNTRVNIIG